MGKKQIVLLFSLLLAYAASFAQQNIEGRVLGDDGEPIVGATIMEKGTTNASITNFDGKFKISCSGNSTLVVSLMGMRTEEVSLENRTYLDIVMSADDQAIDEVVVTALGIKKSEKTLTYAQQQIGEGEIGKTQELNFVSSLSGKTSGVQLKKNASGAGGSTKIVLRGNKSVFGVSSPLFVIDGIPMVNNNSSSPHDFWGGRDGGDGLSQINPDDIANISILKGANAAALYGSQGANGVIIITTKKGDKGKIKGNISSGVALEYAMELPDLQFKYGSDGGDQSWSTKSGNYDNKFVDDFFLPGVNYINSFSLSGGNEHSTAYLSYANTNSHGIMRQNTYNKHNITIKQTSKYFKDRLTISSRVMLTDENAVNRAQSGYYYNPLTGLYLFPRNLNFNNYRHNYEVYDITRNMMLQNWHTTEGDVQNPFWIINNNKNTDHTKRLIANLSVNYKINDHFSAQIRGNYDYTNIVFEKKVKAGTCSTLSHENGRWYFNDYNNTQMYTDAIITYQNVFGNWDVNATLGVSFEKQTLGEGVTVDSDTHGLQYANEFSFQNLVKQVSVNSTMNSRLEKQSIFGSVMIGYKNMIYFEASGRRDWSSSFAFTNNVSYFYPSFGLTLLVNEMMELPEFISLAKLRSSYSIVSTEVPSFFTRPLNSIGINGVKPNTEKPFTELKPEDQKSLEIGMDLRFWNNRLGVDITYYNINNNDQFIPLKAPSGSGYTKYYVNAGHIQNKGIEASVHAVPVKNSNITWSTDINFSKNTNKIIELHEELKGKYLITNMDGYALYITEGGSFGDIYVSKFERDEQGRIKLGNNGAPNKTSEPELIGNSNPDFHLGWNNTLSFKGFDFSFLIDGSFGGKAVSMTQAILDGYGVSKATADARDAGTVSINAVDEKGQAVSSIDPKLYYTTVGGRGGVMENYVYDATNVRLRQLAISYNFNLVQYNMFFKKATLSLTANNLFFIYKDAPFDPDMSMSSGHSVQSVEFFNIPATRTYGFNLKINF